LKSDKLTNNQRMPFGFGSFSQILITAVSR
jgi:hypothetical protein